MRPLAFLICLLSLPVLSRSQDSTKTSSFFLSVEPNMMFADRKFSDYQTNKELYIKNKNALGVSINFGYQVERNHLFANLQTHFLLLRNAISIDYANSGINNYSEIKYSNDHYGYDYATAQGLNINGGYKLSIGKRSKLYLGLGAHMDFTFIYSSSHSVQLTTSDSGTGTFKSVYNEDVPDNQRLAFGGDAFATYSFQLGRATMFVGGHFSYTPGQTIKASFQSFTGTTAENSGTVELHRSYAGLTLGMFMGRKVKK
ncbi:MAG: hypothetical protein ABI378_03375 [Chitinophagaceae bacterium]